MRRAVVFALFAALCSLAGQLGASTSKGIRRIAVVIGANDSPPGRAALRFAHDDARRMADVLLRVGRFAKSDVHILLEPTPDEIIGQLERIGEAVRGASGDTMLVFYYSGHSDGQFVFPRGMALSMRELRDRMSATAARLRLGIIDTCRGGSWTQAKGLSVAPPLTTPEIVPSTSEGTALLSSSSGFENAHEAEAVRGSFFTHHLVGGLLGGADHNRDGSVTLQEVFEYAKERTVRDSARMASTAQHPSFDVQLRGRQDIVLSHLAASSSALDLRQTEGPLEVIHLSSGLTVAETPAGTQHLRLALPPGRYLVRKAVGGQIHTKEVALSDESTTSLLEGQLDATGSNRLAFKGEDDTPLAPSQRAAPPAGFGRLQVAAGVAIGPSTRWGSTMYVGSTRAGQEPLERSLTGFGALTYGITDRLTWPVLVPALAYRFGDEGRFEVVPQAGLIALGYTPNEGLFGTVQAAVALRAFTAQRQSVLLTVSASSQFFSRGPASDEPLHGLSSVRLRAEVGYTLAYRNLVGFAFAAGVQGYSRADAVRAHTFADAPETSVMLGSVQQFAYRLLPLISVHISNRMSLDGYAAWMINLRTRALADRYLVGATWTF